MLHWTRDGLFPDILWFLSLSLSLSLFVSLCAFCVCGGTKAPYTQSNGGRQRGGANRGTPAGRRQAAFSSLVGKCHLTSLLLFTLLHHICQTHF